MNPWAAKWGSPMPFGVTWIEEEQAYNFSLYSKYATGVLLLLYAEQDLVRPVYQHRMTHPGNKTGPIWHCRIPLAAVDSARYYGYVVEGPYDPAAGHRFDPQKVLLDPYAKAVYFPEGFSREAARRPGSNVGRAPLGVLCQDPITFAWGQDAPPHHTFDTVIYELHVKGFTMRPNSGVRADRRGTYAGLIEKIPYLKDLGITVVELLPIFQYDPMEGNYWGYMPLNFFSPHRDYACSRAAEGPFHEFRALVKALHEAGIEVVLDVVYNHTTEEDHEGPTYSYRGIDNRSYYLLEADRRWYRNDAGTGNVLRSGHRQVRKMILDSLHFWVQEMHVDGFRFDLASILTRDDTGAINLHDPPILSQIAADPHITNLRQIAEPWDLSSNQLGRSFPTFSWSHWNARFRDDVRSFVKGDRNQVTALMTRLYGSDDLFPDDLPNAYHPYQSVNYITAHDGFCLYDLVAYNTKHNEANGHQNADGPEDNFSWNCGWEGDENVPPAVMALRRRQIKNFCCLLFLANGTPMFCAGDEFMNTQGGNNNPYNQDNETTWLNWDLLEKNREMFRFFKRMMAFRKAHPSLGRSHFWREDVRWYGVGARVDSTPDSHSLAFCLHGAAEQDDDIYVMINAYWEDLTFTVQEGSAREWGRVVDTSLPSPCDFSEPGQEVRLASLHYTVRARSIVILLRLSTDHHK